MEETRETGDVNSFSREKIGHTTRRTHRARSTDAASFSIDLEKTDNRAEKAKGIEEYRSIDRKALTFPSFPHTEAACSTRLRSVTHREITAKPDGADPQPWACVSARVPCRSACSCCCCCRRTRILRVVVSYLGVHASLLVSLLAPPCVAVCDPRPGVS